MKTMCGQCGRVPKRWEYKGKKHGPSCPCCGDMNILHLPDGVVYVKCEEVIKPTQKRCTLCCLLMLSEMRQSGLPIELICTCRPYPWPPDIECPRGVAMVGQEEYVVEIKWRTTCRGCGHRIEKCCCSVRLIEPARDVNVPVGTAYVVREEVA